MNQLGGYRCQGKTPEKAAQLLRDAKALKDAGAFSDIVLECVPAPLAQLITERVSVPTIGIGAGVYCDGQVQVINDILATCPDYTPRHARTYASVGSSTADAIARYRDDVRGSSFPTEKQSFTMDPSVLSELLQYA